MKQKTKQGLSTFCKDLISMGIFILIFILSIHGFKFGQFFSGNILYMLGLMLSTLFIFFKLILIQNNLENSINFKYKIIKEKNSYRVKVLKPWFWILIWWQPLSKKYHSYETENIFGGKSFGGYSTEEVFYSEENAKKGIEKYKIKAQMERDSYFKRPEKRIITIIKA